MRLETLELADCEHISDTGFAGQEMNDIQNLEENPTGHSIGRLKSNDINTFVLFSVRFCRQEKGDNI